MLDVGSVEGAYKQHAHSVLRRARRLLGDEQEAKEVLQEVFMSLLDRPAQFAERSAISTWLYSATTHRCLNRLRNRRTQQRILEENRDRIVRPADSSASAEDRALVRELLAKMPDELAQVAVYYYFDELTHAEIAEVLECSRRHVGDLLARFQKEARAAEAAG